MNKNLKKNFRRIIGYLKLKHLLHWLPDTFFLKLMFFYRMGEKLNLERPEKFNEKLQWLKINDKNPNYINLVDKLEVRKIIEKKLGKEYLIPLLGSWDKFDDIDFSKLPNKFVLKTTHDSGGVYICYDKDKLNIDEAKKKIQNSLSRNYYYAGKEWPYKNIKPRIICEELISTKDGKLPHDYKFHCFHGEVDNVMLCIGRETGKPKFYFFDKDWNLLKYNITGKNAPENFTIDKPSKIDKMFEIAKILSENIPFVRVDLYCENEKIYFGEMTFYPQSGFDKNLLRETDIMFGNKISIKN